MYAFISFNRSNRTRFQILFYFLKDSKETLSRALKKENKHFLARLGIRESCLSTENQIFRKSQLQEILPTDKNYKRLGRFRS